MVRAVALALVVALATPARADVEVSRALEQARTRRIKADVLLYVGSLNLALSAITMGLALAPLANPPRNGGGPSLLYGAISLGSLSTAALTLPSGIALRVFADHDDFALRQSLDADFWEARYAHRRRVGLALLAPGVALTALAVIMSVVAWTSHYPDYAHEHESDLVWTSAAAGYAGLTLLSTGATFYAAGRK